MQKSLCEYLVVFSNGSGKIYGLTYKKVTFRYNDKDDQLKINIHTILKRLKKFKSGVLRKIAKFSIQIKAFTVKVILQYEFLTGKFKLVFLSFVKFLSKWYKNF